MMTAHSHTTKPHDGMPTSSLLRGLAAVGLIASLSLSAACGGPPASGPPSSPRNADPGAAPAPASWSKEMTQDQQMAFMKTNILPAMGPVFQSHDATKYADFSCNTCHGPAYKNPHDYLPRLTMKDGNLTAFAEKPEVARFMAESIAPKMAASMGLPPYNMQTHQGFGCGGCHAIDMK